MLEANDGEARGIKRGREFEEAIVRASDEDLPTPQRPTI